jgi:hypothetical protein
MTRIDRATQAEGEAEAAALADEADDADKDWPVGDPDVDRDLPGESAHDKADDHDQEGGPAADDHAYP